MMFGTDNGAESFNTKRLKHERHVGFIYGFAGKSLLSFVLVVVAAAGVTFGLVRSTENHTLF